MSSYRRSIIILLALGVFPTQSYALNAVPVNSSLTQLHLGPSVEYIEDKSKKLSFADILSQKDELVWQRGKSKRLGFGFSTSAFWVRFSLQNPSKEPVQFYLQQAYPPTDLLTVYIPRQHGSKVKKNKKYYKKNKSLKIKAKQKSEKDYKVVNAGDQFPFALREVPYRNFLFSIRLKANTTETFYVRFENLGSTSIVLSLLSGQVFQEIRDSEMIFIWMFNGIYLVMIIYNMIIFIVTRDLSYLFYVVFIGSFAVFAMSITGPAFQYLWPENPWLANFAVPISMAVIAISSALFVKYFVGVTGASADGHSFLDSGSCRICHNNRANRRLSSCHSLFEPAGRSDCCYGLCNLFMVYRQKKVAPR